MLRPTLIILLLLFSSCSHSHRASGQIGSALTLPVVLIRPGEVQKISFPSPLKIKSVLSCKDQELVYKQEKKDSFAFISESYFSDQKPYQCFYISFDEKNGEMTKIPVFNVQVGNKEFPKERLSVNPKHVILSAKDKQRVKREQLLLNEIYRSSSNDLLISRGFEIPLSSKVTSIYGSRRIFNNNHETQHLGTDYRASIGVPIPVSNSGKVVFARDLFYTGNTVIVDHGMGIFTMYGHLSKIFVRKDDYVLQGQEIGSAGKSGRASGPHLHWGVKVHKEWIDGDSLVLLKI